ncbi:MAG: hypothetical protein K9L21_03635 [Spirochaetia bacterium]|nr:hypothetical protein [Spirochaetia bacterium]
MAQVSMACKVLKFFEIGIREGEERSGMIETLKAREPKGEAAGSEQEV